MKKKLIIKIIVTISILLTCVGLGVGGYILYNTFFVKQAELDDSEALYQTTLKERPTDGSDPSEYNLADNVAIALWTIENTDEFWSLTTGTANAAGTNQDVYNKRVVKDDKAMITMVSYGLVKTSKQRYFLPDKVLLRDGKVTGPGESTWNTDVPECVSYNTIKKRYGWLPWQGSGYIVCEDTYLDKSQMTTMVTKNADGTYTLIYDLDPSPDKAPFYYRREVLTNSGSSIIPEFHSIHCELIIDNEWKIIESNITEQYKVKAAGVEAVTKTSCHEEFHYDNVEFDKSAYDFFESYSYLEALDDAEDAGVPKTDAMGMIVESLQKKDKSDSTFDITIEYGDFSTGGTVALNISDLENIKVLAELDDLYVEYTDSVYISIGGVKVKANIEELSAIIAKITDELPESSDSSGMELDVSQIMADLNASKVVETDNHVTIDSKLNLLGIELPLHFEINKIDDSYELESANVALALNGKDLKITLAKTDNMITPKDHSQFADAKNIEFVVDYVASVIKNKNTDVKMTLDIEGVNVTVFGNIDFTSAIDADAVITVSNGTDTLDVLVKYTNDTIYLDLDGVKVKITTEDLIKIINKFTDTSNATAISLESIDLESILKTVFSIDYDELLKELILDDGNIELSLGLSTLVDKLDTLKLSLKKTEYGLNGMVSLNGYKLDIEAGSLNYSKHSINDSEYQNLGYIESILDEVLAIYEAKKAKVTINLAYSDIKVTGSGIIDFTDSIEANINMTVLLSDSNTIDVNVAYIDDVLYLTIGNANLKITKDELKDIIGIFTGDTSSDSIDVNSIINTVLSLDLDSIVKNLELAQDKIGLTLDLTSVISLLGELKVELKKLDGITVNITAKDIKGGIKVAKTNESVSAVTGEYQSLAQIKPILEVIKKVVDSNGAEVNIALAKDDLEVSGKAYLMFEDELKVKADLTIKYSDLEVSLTLYYFAEENKIYIDVLNNHLSLSLDELNTSSGDDSSLLDTILDINFTKLLSNILTANGLTVELDLSDFDKLESILDLTKKSTITLKSVNDSIILTTDNLLSLSGEVKGYTGSITLPNNTYTSLDGLVSDILELVSWIGNESIGIVINGSVSIKDIDIDINGTVDAVLDTNKEYAIDGTLYISVAGTDHTVGIKYISNMLYVTYGGANIGLDLTNAKDFFDDIMEILEIDSSLDLSKINPVLDTLVVGDKSLSINLSSLIDIITNITVALDYVSNNEKFLVNVTGNEINLAVTANKIASHNVVAPTDYIDNDDVIKLCHTIKRIIDLKDRRSFNLDVDLSIYDNGDKHLDVTGNLGIKLTTVEWKDFKIEDLSMVANLAITEYNTNDGSVKVTHRVDLTLTDGKLYIIYGNKESNLNSKIRLYTEVDSLMSVAASLTKVLDIDLELLNDYLDEAISYVDLTQLKDLVESIMNSSSSSSTNLNVSDKILSLFVTNDGGLDAVLKANIISSSIPSNKEIYVSLESSDETPVRLSLTGLYTDYVSEGENTKIDINNVELNNDTFDIIAPNTNSGTWYDISEIDNLVNGILATASNKDFQFSGDVTMKVLSLINITVPVDGKARVLDDGSPEIYVHLDMTNLGVGALMLSSKNVYIYYKDGYVYINRVESKTQYQLKITYQEFFDDLVYYLLDFGMGMPNSVMSAINSSSDDNEDYVVDAGKVIKTLNFTSTKYTIGLDLEALTGNSNLGDLSLALNLSPVAIAKDEDGTVHSINAFTSISNISVNLVSVIDITCNQGIKLTNFTTDEAGKKWFTDIDMTSVDSYIDSYTYPVDCVYKNGKYDGRRNHSVTFVMGHKDAEIFSASTGTPITFPNPGVVEDNGKFYVLTGWYNDKYCTEAFTESLVSESNIKVYAGWREVSYYDLTVHSMDGDMNESIYDGADLTELLTKTTYKDSLGNTYLFKGYSLTLGGDIVDISVMPEANLELYAVWEAITYKIYLDGAYMQDVTTSLALSGNYMLTAGDVYYGFDSNTLTYDVLIGKYSKYATIDENVGYFYLETNASKTGYYTVTFDVNDSFNDKVYTSVIIPTDKAFDSAYLPNGKYNNLSINYWYNSLEEYNLGNISSMTRTNRTLKAYYASYDLMTYGYDSVTECNVVTNYTYDGTDAITVILPKYVLINNQYVVLESLQIQGEGDETVSPFTGKANIGNIYFNDGFKELGANAFKNCKNIKNIYFSKTVTSIASDAFYMKDIGNYKANRDVAQNVRFYFYSNNSLDISSWLACNHTTGGKRYYGSEYNFWNNNSATGDFSNAKQTYSSDLRDLVHNLY